MEREEKLIIKLMMSAGFRSADDIITDILHIYIQKNQSEVYAIYQKYGEWKLFEEEEMTPFCFDVIEQIEQGKAENEPCIIKVPRNSVYLACNKWKCKPSKKILGIIGLLFQAKGGDEEASGICSGGKDYIWNVKKEEYEKGKKSGCTAVVSFDRTIPGNHELTEWCEKFFDEHEYEMYLSGMCTICFLIYEEVIDVRALLEDFEIACSARNYKMTAAFTDGVHICDDMAVMLHEMCSSGITYVRSEEEIMIQESLVETDSQNGEEDNDGFEKWDF